MKQFLGSPLGPNRHGRSIRHFIFVAAAVMLCLLSAVDVVIDYRYAAHAMAQTRDRLLGRIATGYLRALRDGDADTSSIPISVLHEELGDDDIPYLRFRVSNDQGELIGGDSGLRVPPPAVHRSGVQPAIYDDDSASASVRVAVVHGDVPSRGQGQAVTLQVAEPAEARRAVRSDIFLGILLHQLLRLGAVLVVLWIVIVAGFAPLGALQRELQRRKPDDLSPIDTRRPRELAPLVATINQHMAAQQAAADQQRRSLADASHQLRTPIAVLRTLVESTMLGQTEHAESLPKMLGIIERATALTDQLLSLAKAEQLIRRRSWVDVPLDVVARDVAIEFAPLIARKRLDFSLQAVPIVLRTDPWLIAEFVKNLLSNAIHHSPRNASLGIVIRRHRDETEMIVWDHGGGIDAEVMPRLFEPFTAAKGGTGIGLGLSICRQIAGSMNANLQLFNRIEAGETTGVDAVVRWAGATHAAYVGDSSSAHA